MTAVPSPAARSQTSATTARADARRGRQRRNRSAGLHADQVRRLGQCIAQGLGAANVELADLEQLRHGGARSTWTMTARWDAEGHRHTHRIVLKQDPLQADGSIVPGSVLDEYRWYQRLHAAGTVRVPKPLLAEPTGTVLGSPFMVTLHVPGSAEPYPIFRADYDEVTRAAVAIDAFEQLGRLAATDTFGPNANGTPACPGAAANAWQAALDEWQTLIARRSLGALPMVDAACARLRATPPPAPMRGAIVHGDYRLGNFLYTPAGVQAVLDWEMAHFGDPHEDIAWALHPRWRWRDPSKVWGLIDEPAALAAWARGSGRPVDARALHWWRLFVHVKAAALWLNAAYAAKHGRTDRLDYILVHWQQTPREEACIAQWLEGSAP